MNPLRLDKSWLVATLLMGFCAGDLLALTGCVYPYPGSEVVVGPPPVPGPSLNIGFYGTPAGYYYRNYPVYIYRGRPAYYYGGRRYYYRPGHRYHYRSGYRYYY